MPAAPLAAKSTRKFHFISGLPRSGSTLLAAILNQNPRFRAGMTSPLADIMGVVIAEASSKNDFSFDVSDDQRVAMLRGLVENFYAGYADAGDRAVGEGIPSGGDRAVSDRAVSEGTPSGDDRAVSDRAVSEGTPSGDVVFDTSRL